MIWAIRALDVLLRPGAVDDCGVLLLDAHALGLAEHLKGHVLELDAKVLGDHRAGGEDRDVLEHRLAAIAEARRLDRRDLQAAAQLVDDQRRQRFALDVLGDDEQRLAGLHDGLEDGQHRLQRGELLLVDENVGVLELGDHLLGVGDEIGREIAAIELHALDDVEFGHSGLRLLDRDHALVADLFHRVGDHLADRLVAVGGDRADLADLFGGLDLLGAALDVLDDSRRRQIDAALESIGFMPAATSLRPSFMIEAVSTVAVVVPSPALSLVFEATSRTIWRPCSRTCLRVRSPWRR